MNSPSVAAASHFSRFKFSKGCHIFTLLNRYSIIPYFLMPVNLADVPGYRTKPVLALAGTGISPDFAQSNCSFTGFS
jgi:hypothetical protein